MATPIAVRVRTLLAVHSRERLEAIFRELDADRSGALSEAELTRGLAQLGVRVTQTEAEDLLDLFDVSDNGSLSLSAFLAFVSSTPAADGSTSVGQLIARVRGALLGAGQDALQDMFKDSSGRPCDALTAAQLRSKLTSLGVSGVTDEVISLLLARMDANADGSVTAAELSRFLSQRDFERVVRRLMENAADMLRDRGTTLRAELLRAARRDAATAAAAGRLHPIDEDSGTPEIAYSTLKQVLVDDLGFPLSHEQLDAVLQCADLDGNGHCVIDEVLFLAGEDGEDDQDEDAPVDDYDDAEDDAEEDMAAQAAAAVPLEDFVTVLPLGTGRDDWWTPAPPPAAVAAAPAAALVMDDAFSAWAAAVTTVFNAAAAADAFRASTGPAPPTTPTPSGAPPPVTMDVRRMPQTLNVLGMSVSAAEVNSMLTAAVAPGEQPGQAIVFARICDAVMDARARAGVHGLAPLTEGRIRRACSVAAHGGTFTHGLTSSTEAYMMTRTCLAAALVSVPGAALSMDDTITIACACPGALQPLAARILTRHADAIAHGAGAGVAPPPSAAGLASVTRRGSGAGFTVSRILSNAITGSLATPPRGVPESKSDDDAAGAATREEEADLAQVPLPVAIARACPYADIDSEVFMAWLRGLSRDPACRVRLMPAPAPQPAAGTGVVDAAPAAAVAAPPAPLSSAEWLSLSSRAQAAVRKLTSPVTNIPLPGKAIAVYVNTAGAAGGAGGSVSGTTINSTFMTALARLPMSFMPSFSASIMAVHPHTNVLRALLDGGDEADPAGTLAATPSADASALHARAGLGADGIGLHLRHASILQGALDAPSSRGSPAMARTAAPVLRGIGAAATPADISWASEGALVRPQVQTAIVALQAASGVPIPVDEAVRSLILARIARIYLLQLSPNASDPQAPRMRILSNAVPCLASWAPTTEDVWTFNDVPAASMISRCVLRCDQPRDMAAAGVQTGTTYVCIELNALLASPPAIAPPTDAATMRVAAVDDGMHMEEVTCAWGAVPLSQLCSTTVSSHKVTLTGGALGAQADISTTDILQRRSNWRALTKAITGAKAAPEITLTTSLLSRLKVTERQELARLPLCIVLPHASVGVIVAWRRLYATLVLAHTHSHVTAADDVHGPAHDVACFVQALSSSVEGLGGDASPLSGVSAMSSVTLLALARAMDEALAAAQKRRGGAPSPSTVLSELLARLWSTVAFAGNGLLAPPALMSELLTAGAKTDATASLTSADMAYKPFALSQGMV